MGYAKRSLGDSEQILREGAIPWPYHVGAWSALIVLGIVVIGIVIFARIMVWIATTEFVLTNRRIILKTGWLRRETEELALTSIEEVQVDQGFWGRLLGFGRLRLSGSGTGEVASPPIADPVGFRARLSDARARLLED